MEKAGNHAKSLDKIQSIIVQLANGNKVPVKQCQELKHRSKGDTYPDFEIRVKQLRIYFFANNEKGEIIVLGEVKKGSKTQSKSISRLRDIKLEYFASKEIS